VHFGFIRDNAIGADDVMRVLWTRIRNAILEDNCRRFIDRELGSFDEIGEIGFEKRQCRSIAGGGLPRLRRRAMQFRAKQFE